VNGEPTGVLSNSARPLKDWPSCRALHRLAGSGHGTWRVFVGAARGRWIY